MESCRGGSFARTTGRSRCTRACSRTGEPVRNGSTGPRQEPIGGHLDPAPSMVTQNPERSLAAETDEDAALRGHTDLPPSQAASRPPWSYRDTGRCDASLRRPHRSHCKAPQSPVELPSRVIALPLHNRAVKGSQGHWTAVHDAAFLRRLALISVFRSFTFADRL